jgi:hypothetical protein
MGTQGTHIGGVVVLRFILSRFSEPDPRYHVYGLSYLDGDGVYCNPLSLESLDSLEEICWICEAGCQKRNRSSAIKPHRKRPGSTVGFRRSSWPSFSSTQAAKIINHRSWQSDLLNAPGSMEGYGPAIPCECMRARNTSGASNLQRRVDRQDIFDNRKYRCWGIVDVKLAERRVPADIVETVHCTVRAMSVSTMWEGWATDNWPRNPRHRSGRECS